MDAARHVTQITARRVGTKMYPLFVEDWNQVTNNADVEKHTKHNTKHTGLHLL